MKQVSVSFLVLAVAGFLLTSQAAFGAGAEEPAAMTQTVGEGPYGKYDPPVEVTLVHRINDTLQKSVLKNNQKIDDNMWLDEMRERLGVDIKFLWIAKTDQELAEKFNLAMASGDLPDILKLNTPPIDLFRLYEADQLQPLDDVWPEYVSEQLWNDVYQHEQEASFQSATFDGKLYGIPATTRFPGEDNAAFVWVRKDWMENLGLSKPQTFDDVIALARAFTYDDPDQNGDDDTFGILFRNNMQSGAANMTVFFNAHHAYPNIWIEKGGELVYGSVQPEMKKPLALLRQLYEEGVIDQEFPTRAWSDLPKELVTNRVGLMLGAQWVPLNPLLESIRDQPERDWVPFMVPSSDDKPVRISVGKGFGRYFAVNKDYPHPEVLPKLLNMFWDMYAFESSTFAYPVSPDGETWQAWLLFPFTVNKPGMNFNTHLTIEHAFANDISIDQAMEETGHQFGEVRDMYNYVVSFQGGNREDWGWAKIFAPGGPDETSMGGMVEIIKNGTFLPDGYLGIPGQAMIDKMGTLKALQDETFVKIITGDADMDEFDEFVEQWHALGGAEITADVNTWYATQ